MSYSFRNFSLVFLGLLLAAPVHAERTQDVFFGSRSTGPFVLSWKHIAPGTETVRVNTVAQMRGLDYSLDAETGTLTFTRPLPIQSGVEVTYEYDPGHAVRSGGGWNLPLAWDLARTERGTLSLNALYKNQGTGLVNSPGTLTLGLGAGWQSAQSQFNSRLLFAPALSPEDGKSAASVADRFGMALSGATDMTRLARFSFGYTRAGVGLGSAAGENGLTMGAQTLTLGGKITPSRRLAAVIDYTQSDPLAEGGRAKAKFATALTYAPVDTMQLQTHWTQSSGDGSDAQSADISLAAKANATTQLGATFQAHDGPGDKNDGQSVTLSAQAAPSKAVSLEAHLGQSSVGSDGATQTADLKVNARPTGTAQIEATFQGKNAPADADDAQSINLAAAVSPAKTLSVTASAGQSRQGASATDRQEVRVALTPRADVQLQTGLVLRQDDQFQTTVATFAGAARPASFLQFSALYRDRVAPAADLARGDTLDTSAAQVSLTPVKGLRLTATYAQNPDNDGRGDPQPLAQRGLGVETAVGALSLSGGYDWSRQYDTPSVGTTLRVGLGLRFSRALLLTGDYKQTLTGLGDSPLGTSLYTVGLSHNLGERFNLSMTGTVKQPVGQTAGNTPDYTANANLGMKF